MRLSLLLSIAFTFLKVQGRIPNKEVKDEQRSNVFFENELSIQERKDIVNGVEAEKGRYPYAVRLISSSGGFCGGSLIHPEWVLSAAHCWDPDFPRVSIGRLDFEDNTEIKGEDYENIPVKFSILHPLYDNSTEFFDIMLVKLKRPSKFPTVKLDLDLTDFTKDTTFTIIGWGDTASDGNSSDTLLESTVDFIPQDECEEHYNLTSEMLCAWSEGTDACQGDSGGALILAGDTPEEDVQVGVVSHGIGCANGTIPGVYSNVQWSLDFIWKVTNGTELIFGSNNDTST